MAKTGRCGCGREASHRGRCSFRRAQGRKPAPVQPKQKAIESPASKVNQKAREVLLRAVAPIARKEERLQAQIEALQAKLEQLRAERAGIDAALEALSRPVLSDREREAVEAVAELQDGARGAALPHLAEVLDMEPRAANQLLCSLVRRSALELVEEGIFRTRRSS